MCQKIFAFKYFALDLETHLCSQRFKSMINVRNESMKHLNHNRHFHRKASVFLNVLVFGDLQNVGLVMIIIFMFPLLDTQFLYYYSCFFFCFSAFRYFFSSWYRAVHSKPVTGWWRGTVARTSFLTGELSLSHARPSDDE